MDWQPIDTAPKDGTRILVDFGRCGDDRKFGPYALRGYIETDVKGWLPLPAPPKESQ